MQSVLGAAARCLTRRHGLLILLLLALAARAGAQRGPAIRLAPANATLTEEFTQIVAVRELRDGRVLVSDRRDNRVVVADFATGRVVPIARVGSGPGEFRQAGSLVAVAGDSTILEDPGGGRWLLPDRDSVVATLPPRAPAVQLTGIVVGGDSLGRALGLHYAGLTDSVIIVLVDRATETSQPIARLSRITITPGPRVKGSNEGYTIQHRRLSEWAVAEQAVLFRDGWAAIARLNPYRVDWHTPDGRTIRGVPLPFVPTQVNDDEKRAFMARRARQTGRPAGSPAGRRDWPATFPPFSGVSSALTRLSAPSMPPPVTTALLAAPDGRLLIDRVPTAATPETHYDVVDRSGTLVGELTLPFNEAIAGFGAKSVYIVSADADGLHRLHRHNWP